APTVVSLPFRSSPSQSDHSNSRARNGLSTQSRDETGTLHFDFHHGQLSRDVQREVRNEPPLREHVGPAAALPCLQSNSDAGVVDKTVSRFSHRRRRRITRGDRVSSVHRPGGALPTLRTHHSRSAAGASDLEVALTGKSLSPGQNPPLSE